MEMLTVNMLNMLTVNMVVGSMTVDILESMLDVCILGNLADGNLAGGGRTKNYDFVVDNPRLELILDAKLDNPHLGLTHDAKLERCMEVSNKMNPAATSKMNPVATQHHESKVLGLDDHTVAPKKQMMMRNMVSQLVSPHLIVRKT